MMIIFIFDVIQQFFYRLAEVRQNQCFTHMLNTQKRREQEIIRHRL